MISIPEDLLMQFERGNVLLFIGDRLLSDPQGRAVLDELTSELVARTKAEDSDYLSFPAAAQIYEDERGRNSLVQLIRDRLEELGHKPQPVHRMIAALTDCRVLVTTGIDQRLELAFEEAGRPLDVFIDTADVAFDDARYTDLFKLRGSMERPESLILTEDDYEIFFESQENMSVILQGYLARMTLLFVGYDLADPYFRRLYRKVTSSLDNLARRAYAFGVVLSRRVSRWCERHGIEVIDINVATFLEELSSQLASRTRATSPLSSLLSVTNTYEPLPQRPYKLLDYYNAEDTAIFFGRADETRKLSSMIHAHRLVLLYGSSGAGKTSLLLAGVVPRMEYADPPYKSIYVRALEDPSAVIRRAVQRQLSDAELPEDGSLVSFLHIASRLLTTKLLIILDQFEEFYIRLSPQFRATFIQDLAALYDAQDVPVKLVLSLREDWLASISEIEQEIPSVFRNRLRLLPFTREQAHEAIIGPAARLGVRYEGALIERLLDDLTGSAGSTIMPPQLQLVCNALYERLKPDEKLIALATYEKLGGVRGVLQEYLQAELTRLPRDERALAQATLEELVTSQGTKAVKTADALALGLGVDPVMVRPMLEQLVAARLLRTLEREDGVVAYELAHEYLIREIDLGGEAKKRKEAEELIKQEVDNWQRFGTLLAPDKLAMITDMRQLLRLNAQEQELLLRSCLQVGYEVDYWLERIGDLEQRLDVLISTANSRVAVVRQRAAQVLGKQQAAKAIDPLIKLAIHDSDMAVRTAARTGLVALSSEQQLVATKQLQANAETGDVVIRRFALEALTMLPQKRLPSRLRLRVWATRVRMQATWLAETSVATPARRAIVVTANVLALLAVLVYIVAANSYYLAAEFDSFIGKTYVDVQRGLPWLPKLDNLVNSGFETTWLTESGRQDAGDEKIGGLWPLRNETGYRQWARDVQQILKAEYAIPTLWYLEQDPVVFDKLLQPDKWNADERLWHTVALGQVGAYQPEFAQQAVTTLNKVLMDKDENEEVRSQAARSLAQIIAIYPEYTDRSLVNAAHGLIENEPRLRISTRSGVVTFLGQSYKADPNLIPEDIAFLIDPLIKVAKNQSSATWWQAVSALQLMGEENEHIAEQMTQKLIEIILNGEENSDVRASVASALSSIIDNNSEVTIQAIYEDLMKLLIDDQENDQVRSGAAEVLAAQKASEGLAISVTNNFVDILGSEGISKDLRQGVISALGSAFTHHAQFVNSQMLTTLSTPAFDPTEDRYIRTTAIYALGSVISSNTELATQDLFQPLFEIFANADENTELRWSAADALSNLIWRNPELINVELLDTLIKFLENTSEDSQILMYNVRMLDTVVESRPELVYGGIMDALRIFYTDESIDVGARSSAGWALGQVAIADADLYQSIEDLLGKQLGKEDIRDTAASALTLMYTHHYTATDQQLYDKLFNPHDPLVRPIAAQTIFKIGLQDSTQLDVLRQRLNLYVNSKEPLERIWANKTLQLLDLAEQAHEAVKDPSQKVEIENRLRNSSSSYKDNADIYYLGSEPKLPTFYGPDFETALKAALYWIDEQTEDSDQ